MILKIFERIVYLIYSAKQGVVEPEQGIQHRFLLVLLS